MTPTTTTAESLDHLDPWGFGRCGTDDRTAVIEYFEPLDEPVDDDEPVLVTLPGPMPVSATPFAATRPPQPSHGAADRAAMHLPFPKQMLGVLGLFAAVIFAQAFYIGFSLTGEASARPDVGEIVIPSHPVGAPARVDTGALRVDAGAASAHVLIDGALAGSTPFLEPNLSAGEHAVRVEFRDGAVVERRLTVSAGETVSLVLDAPVAKAVVPAGPASGWVHIDAPFEAQVFERGQLVGTSAADRILMSAGTHDLELANASLGYRARMKAVVAAGKVARVSVDTPRVPVAINAQPWAEVVVDGRVLGETPLANLLLPIGEHQIELRHPDLGARIETVTVRATGANRVSADLRR